MTLIALVTAIVVCIQQAIATARHPPRSTTSAGPLSSTLLDTLIVPPTEGQNPAGGAQQIWPGIGAGDGSTYLLNHVTNVNGANDRTFEVANLAIGVLAGRTPIYGGQAATNIFAKDITNGQWLDAWLIESGVAPTVNSYAGSYAFIPASTSATNKAFQSAILAVEFQGTATWNFGPVSWQNVIIIAETTSTAWCTSPVTSWKNLEWSTPIATVDVPYTTCYINSVTFNGP